MEPKKEIKSKINWFGHSDLYMNVFIALAVITGGVIYMQYDQIMNINESTQTNIANSVFPTNQVTTTLKWDSQNKSFKFKLENSKTKISIANLLQNLQADYYLTYQSAIVQNGIELQSINEINAIPNGKKWNCYVNSKKITTSIDQKMIKGGDKIEFIYE